MTLQDWLANGWLKTEQTSASEIGALLNTAREDISESKRDDITLPWRLRMAYSASLAFATVALRAENYRIPNTDGYHYRTIESLRLTIGWDQRRLRVLQSIRGKRNLVSYDAFGIVSNAEVLAAIQLAEELETIVQDWLHAEHPELIK